MAGDKTTPIILNGLAPFSKGGNRFCYVSPLDPLICLKVDQPHRSPEMRRRKKSFSARLRPIRYFDENVSEVTALAKLHRMTPGGHHQNLPKSYGLIETDMGFAHATDLVRDVDGRISETLEMYLSRNGLDKDAIGAIDEFRDTWIRTALITRELLPHNLLIQKGKDGFRLILIDGFGRRTPANRLPVALRRIKVSTRLKNMEQRISLFLKRKEGCGELPQRLSNLDRDQ